METLDLRRKLADRWWRLNNLYWVLSPAGKPVLFQPNEAQTDFLQNRHFLAVTLKARQLGFSTVIQIDMLDRCLFNTNWTAAVIAQNRDTASDIMENKLKFAYERLPEPIKEVLGTKQDSSRKLVFANGSSVTVGTSLRGGTFQQLHVSELGDIAATYPRKAREIRTGAFNTVAEGNLIDVESTAKGNDGEFFDLVQTARNTTEQAEAQGRALVPLEWKFNFYPWWREEQYSTDPDNVTVKSRQKVYFDRLAREHGIELSRGQKAWYVLKEDQQGIEDMHREHPSYPDEAFEIAIEGAYYAGAIRDARVAGRITDVPLSDQLPVNTAWDLGMSDSTVIWFFQVAGREIRIVDYYENSDMGISHYASVMRDKEYWYGTHYGPHDLNVRELMGSGGVARTRQEIAAQDYGINFQIIQRVEDMRDGREAVRQVLPMCYFDQVRCSDGIKALENYKREWMPEKGTYSNQPRHDWASHGAKAFETMARAPLFGTMNRHRPAAPVRKVKWA